MDFSADKLKDCLDKSKGLILKQIENMKMEAMGFLGKWGLAGILAIALVIAKDLIFYSMMGVNAGILFIMVLSLWLTGILFYGIKNKWIPAVVYFLLSFLMFADVTYCSFFNKYLSVGLLGNAGMLGDVWGSIKAVVKPLNFFMLADAVYILGLITYRRLSLVKGRQSEYKAADEDSGVYVESQPRDILAELDAMWEKENGEKSSEDTQDEAEEEAKPEEAVGIAEEEEKAEKESKEFNGRVKRRRKTDRLKRLRTLNIYKALKRLIPVYLSLVAMVFSSVSPFCQSIAKQEFFSYHISDIGINALGLEAKPKLIPFTDHYEKEKEGEFFGIGKGRNLVVIQIESFQNFLLNREYNGQEITPFLNQLAKDNTTYFDNYYQQVGTGNTSDAEFATNNSIMGSIEAFTYQIYENNYFRGLPWLLKEQGYETSVLHGHENRAFWNRDDIYDALGFDRYYGGLIGDPTRLKGDFKMTEWMGWGLTDTEFYPQAMNYIKKFNQPFYSFIITLSNHHPYIMLDKYSFIELKPEDKDTMAGNYINSAAYTDYALKELFDLFKKEGLYENSVFALYGDHMGLAGDEETDAVMERILGHKYDWDDKMNIPLLIHIPNAGENFTQTIHNVGGQIDFMPTIAYIMGMEHLDTLYLGHNIFNYSEGVVAEHAYLPYGSFFLENISFEMSRSGIFKNGRAWEKAGRKEVDIDNLYGYYSRAMEISDTSIYILKKDLLRKIYEEGLSREEALNPDKLR